MAEELTTIKVYTIAGRMYCSVLKGRKDITSEVESVVLTLDNGRIITTNIVGKKNDRISDRA